MRKYCLLLVVLLQNIYLLAQGTAVPPIKLDLPTIIPPSPTVAALMKFEEVPVSNYTGIPDISIPLYSSSTLSKDINMDISLKYHPSGVAASERSSDVGLGWSLFAGGTISRTVKGKPDDIFEMGQEAKIGLYHNSVGNFQNKYYEIINEINDENTTAYDTIDEFLWDAQVRGRLDTEHDLWQFNFMGETGRFYIKKDSLNQLVVTPLDEYRVKIKNIYGNPQNIYKPTSFEIHDEKGYKYIFDVAETTTVHTSSISASRISGEDSGLIPGGSYAFQSAFHLSKIIDANGNILVDILYTAPMVEITHDSSITYYNEDYTRNLYSPRDFYLLGPCGTGVTNFNPYSTYNSTINQRENAVKKISKITITGKAKIEFNYIQGREDANFHLSELCYLFKGLTVKDSSNAIIKKVKLEHGYSITKQKRLILDKVSFVNPAETLNEDYTLEYRENINPSSAPEYVGMDYWGYFNIRPPYNSSILNKEPDPLFGTSELLQKMTYPTGGCAIFDFEANTYSYDGSTALTNFDANVSNWDSDTKGETFYTHPFNASTNRRYLFSITEAQDVTFVANIATHSGTNALQYNFIIYGASGVSTGGFIFGADENDTATEKYYTIHLLPGDYEVTFISTVPGSHPDFISSSINVFYANKNTNNYQYLYGGGNRIKTIGYFKDSNIPKDYYQNYIITPLPEKERHYNYSTFSNSLKSSGSLTYSIPKFNYDKFKKECWYCRGYNGVGDIPAGAVIAKDDQGGYHYNLFTSFNNLNPIKTQGADVGYQNVTVKETGNGWTEFEYTSPITDPEQIGIKNLSSPFLPTKNIDFRRGLLKKERVYDQSSRILTESILDYDIEESVAITGIRTYYNEIDFVNMYNHEYYFNYKSYIETCAQHPLFISENGCNDYLLTDKFNCDCFCYYGTPRDFTLHSLIEEAFGWAKLKTKTTKNYFYPAGSSLPNFVETEEKYKYNSLNKKIRESSIKNSKNELLRTKYFYHSGDAVTRNRISEIERIETYKDSTLLSKSEILYSNGFSGNTSYLPNFIKTAKDSQTLENRVEYSKYDEYGHPLEVQQADGTKVSYIWGYNKSQPIAKLENFSLSAFAGTTTVANLLSLSNLDVDNCTTFPCSGTEENLRTALNTLRTTYPYALITTYTYDPLIGVTSETDPRGNTIYYSYNSFGRLKSVTDADGNKLSENAYHYKN